jgi:hypothetical protein
MTTSSTGPANTATAAPETPKPSAPPAQSSAPAVPQPAVKKQVNPYEGDSRYAQFKVVNMRLLKEGIIQYDPSFPELQLNTTAAEGMPLPLTPFFASRINQTLELVL